MRIGSTSPRLGFIAMVLVALCVGIAVFASCWQDAQSATITASYEAGYLDVSINGYGTTGMGTFRLDDAGAGHVALCVEASERHSTDTNAYAPVDNRLQSAELDTLVWLIARMPFIDSDTGVAASALAWYYSGARRNIGVPVWADGHRAFAPISPVDPERWDALQSYDLSHLIGLRGEGRDLDTAERRVVELFDTVARMAGPWQLTESDGRVQLTGPAGPISGHSVRVEVRDHTGSPVSAVDLVTDEAGWVSPAVTAMPMGGSVRASTTSPGTHREWDGPGDVQRLITATELPLSVDRRLPAQPGHLLVVKQSTDSTIGVSGAVFELLDASQYVVERVATSADGTARFAPVDLDAHQAPYTIREVSAPAGLRVSSPDQTLPALSANPTEPSTVVMTDAPRTVPIQVVKHLSIDGAGPEDRSGFEFDVVRTADQLTTRLVTGADGRSQPVEIALGDYTVCESRVPDWASGLVDGGCVKLAVTLDTIDRYDETIEPVTPERPPYLVRYVNNVPEPSIVTEVHDSSDGDRILASAGGTAVDVVTLTGLTPGTAYIITGELVPPGGTPSPIGDGEGTPATSVVAPRVTAYAEFTATQTSESHRVEFIVPPLAAGRYVIVERLWVGDHFVAEHADLADEHQTLEIESHATVTTTTSIAPTTVPTVESTVPSGTTPSSTTPSSTTPSSTTPPSTTPSTTNPPETPPPTGPPPTASALTPLDTVAASTTSVARPSAPRLPSTGAGGAPRQLVWFADLMLLLGFGLIIVTRLIPRRSQDVNDR